MLKNRGDGTFEAPDDYDLRDGSGSVTAADFDGDGHADLATANYFDDTVSVLKNRGDGTFAKPVYHSVGRRPLSVTAADLTGDGKADIATANGQRSGSVSVLANKGGGMFKRAVEYGVGAGPLPDGGFRLRVSLPLGESVSMETGEHVPAPPGGRTRGEEGGA